MISKKVISYFSFGVFLLIVGVILMILKKTSSKFSNDNWDCF